MGDRGEGGAIWDLVSHEDATGVEGRVFDGYAYEVKPSLNRAGRDLHLGTPDKALRMHGDPEQVD